MHAMHIHRLAEMHVLCIYIISQDTILGMMSPHTAVQLCTCGGAHPAAVHAEAGGVKVKGAQAAGAGTGLDPRHTAMAALQRSPAAR